MGKIWGKYGELRGVLRDSRWLLQNLRGVLRKGLTSKELACQSLFVWFFSKKILKKIFWMWYSRDGLKYRVGNVRCCRSNQSTKCLFLVVLSSAFFPYCVTGAHVFTLNTWALRRCRRRNYVKDPCWKGRIFWLFLATDAPSSLLSASEKVYS